MLLASDGAWAAAEENAPIRIGLPTSLFSMQYTLIADWRAYLSSKLKRPVEMVLNRRFSNSTVQLYVDKIDFAWVTDYPDIHLRNEVRLVAVPLSKGRPYFTSYLIVPAYDDKTTSLLQLKGAVFALSDAGQNGSSLEVRSQLQTAGEDSAHFFSKIIYTRSHREVIRAVALGLAHAGEVDSIAWDSLAKAHPELAAQTRIVAKSHEYGAPPIVANHFVSAEDYKAMLEVLMDMASNAKGVELLTRMGLDGFIPGNEKIYERTIQMRQFLDAE